MEFVAYIHSALAHEQALQGIELEPPLNCALLGVTVKSLKSARMLFKVSVVVAGLIAGINFNSSFAQAAESSVPEISILQTLLADRGFDPGPIDGVKGEGTTEAIIAAQKFYGLTPDGVVGTETLAALQSDHPTNSKPSPTSDQSIVDLQNLLASRGFYTGAIDGILGSGTQSAIIAAQKFYGLTPDGVAGPATLNALQNDSNSSSSSQTASSGEVLRVQQLLASRGFYTGAIDGILGSGTKSAIIAAQKFYGLTPDGVAGPATIAALQGEQPNATSASTPQTSTSSDEVIALQRLLAQRGFYNGPISGILGPMTKDAIVAAQIFYGLTPDGVAGPRTLSALNTDTKNTNTASTSTSTTTNATSSSTPTPTVSSDEVSRLQQLLTQRGFYSGPIDGLAGSGTRNGIIAAQKFYGLTPDGIAGPQTLAALQTGAVTNTSSSNTSSSNTNTSNSSPFTNTNTSNSTGANTSAIANVQNLLRDRGFYNGSVDGILGPGTKSAIIAAQKFYGLTPDGVAGPATVAALENNANQVNRSNPPTPTTPPATTPSSGNASTRDLQKLLALRGFYTGTADGALGNETKNAIIRAQNFYSIAPADGNPTPSLIERLNNDPFVATNTAR